MFYETKWLLRRCFGPRGLKKPQKVMNCQQKSRFSLFPRAFKNRDPKSYKKSSPGGQNEPQELLRRSQERPKRPQDGPKSALRAARSAPRGAQEQPGAHQKGPKRDPGRPRSAKKPPGTPPGPILASFWGARGLISSNLAVLFEARARSARQSKTLFEITGQKVFCRFGLRLGPENATTTREFTLSPAKTA